MNAVLSDRGLDGARTETWAAQGPEQDGNAAARGTFGRGLGESARGAGDEHAGAAAKVRRRRDGAERRWGERRVAVVQHAAQVHQVARSLQQRISTEQVTIWPSDIIINYNINCLQKYLKVQICVRLLKTNLSKISN